MINSYSFTKSDYSAVCASPVHLSTNCQPPPKHQAQKYSTVGLRNTGPQKTYWNIYIQILSTSFRIKCEYIQLPKPWKSTYFFHKTLNIQEWHATCNNELKWKLMNRSSLQPKLLDWEGYTNFQSNAADFQQ